MGIKLSDHIDPENVKFNDLTMFWDLAMLEVIKDSIGRYPSNEEEYKSHLSVEGLKNYNKIKEENPEWEFPEWLNDKNRTEGENEND